MSNRHQKKLVPCITKVAVLFFYSGFLNSRRTALEYLTVLVAKVIPLFPFVSPVSETKWKQEREEYNKKIFYLESEASLQINKAYMFLRPQFNEKKLLEDLDFKRRMCIFESMRDFCVKKEDAIPKKDEAGKDFFVCKRCGADMAEHRVFVMPLCVFGLYWQMCVICEYLSKLGYSEMLKDLVVYDDRKSQIIRFTFAPAIFALEELLFGEWEKMPLWGYRARLDDVALFDRITRDFWRKKSLRYQNLSTCEESRRRLELRSAQHEVNAVFYGRRINHKHLHFFEQTTELVVQDGNTSTVCLYDRRHLQESLELVQKEIDNTCQQETQQEYAIFPRSVELKHKENKIYLLVDWTDELTELCEVKTLQYPRDNGEMGQDFTKLNLIIGDVFNHPEIFKKGAGFYLRKAGITGALYDFFVITKARYGVKIRMGQIPIEPVVMKKEALVRKLCKCIRELPGKFGRREDLLKEFCLQHLEK